MDIHIISNTEHKMLKRKDITFKVAHEKETPSRESIKRELCKKLNLLPDSTIIVNVEQGFGSRDALCIAHSYDKKESMEKSEPKHLLERIKKSEKTKPLEEAKEAPADQKAGKTE